MICHQSMMRKVSLVYLFYITVKTLWTILWDKASNQEFCPDTFLWQHWDTFTWFTCLHSPKCWCVSFPPKKQIGWSIELWGCNVKSRDACHECPSLWYLIVRRWQVTHNEDKSMDHERHGIGSWSIPASISNSAQHELCKLIYVQYCCYKSFLFHVGWEYSLPNYVLSAPTNLIRDLPQDLDTPKVAWERKFTLGLVSASFTEG